MLLRAGELWMLEKPDEKVKQDYFRLFRVGLKSPFQPDAAPGRTRTGEIHRYRIAPEDRALLYT